MIAAGAAGVLGATVSGAGANGIASDTRTGAGSSAAASGLVRSGECARAAWAPMFASMLAPATQTATSSAAGREREGGASNEDEATGDGEPEAGVGPEVLAPNARIGLTNRGASTGAPVSATAMGRPQAKPALPGSTARAGNGTVLTRGRQGWPAPLLSMQTEESKVDIGAPGAMSNDEPRTASEQKAEPVRKGTASREQDGAAAMAAAQGIAPAQMPSAPMPDATSLLTAQA